jgi:hypothetical protein
VPPTLGFLQTLDGVDQASQLPGIVEVAVQVATGSRVTALPDAVQQNIAFIVADGPSYQAVRDRARAAETAIQVMISDEMSDGHYGSTGHGFDCDLVGDGG